MAARTSVVRFATVLMPWRRPWKVESKVPTLDQLSGGRATAQSASAVRSHDSIPAMCTFAQERARSPSRLMIAL
jgi:alkanesulfonate monooxygenase SsuD/methylene tetrahydromethanopterin reductase-like flavin-dependent oxidoreductase (luciferase family)